MFDDGLGISDVLPPLPRGCALCERETRAYTTIMGQDVCDDCKARLDVEQHCDAILTGVSEP